MRNWCSHARGQGPAHLCASAEVDAGQPDLGRLLRGRRVGAVVGEQHKVPTAPDRRGNRPGLPRDGRASGLTGT